MKYFCIFFFFFFCFDCTLLIQLTSQMKFNSCPLSMVSHFVVSVTHGQLCSEDTEFPQTPALSATDIQLLTWSWLDDPGSPKADDLPSDELPGQGQPKATSQCLRHSPHFISSCRWASLHFTSSQEEGWAQYNKIVKERERESTFTDDSSTFPRRLTLRLTESWTIF